MNEGNLVYSNVLFQSPSQIQGCQRLHEPTRGGASCVRHQGTYVCFLHFLVLRLHFKMCKLTDQTTIHTHNEFQDSFISWMAKSTVIELLLDNEMIKKTMNEYIKAMLVKFTYLFWIGCSLPLSPWKLISLVLCIICLVLLLSVGLMATKCKSLW